MAMASVTYTKKKGTRPKRSCVQEMLRTAEEGPQRPQEESRRKTKGRLLQEAGLAVLCGGTGTCTSRPSTG
jgi:hypothetical protein